MYKLQWDIGKRSGVEQHVMLSTTLRYNVAQSVDLGMLLSCRTTTAAVVARRT